MEATRAGVSTTGNIDRYGEMIGHREAGVGNRLRKVQLGNLSNVARVDRGPGKRTCLACSSAF